MKRADTRDSRIETLKKTQESRKQDCLERVYKAIERLQKIGAKINFHTVAKEANLSVSYLYKYPELKQHLAELRSQQSSMPVSPVAKPASSSHAKVVGRLKERILQLEEQNQELRRKNEALAGQVYRVHYLQEQVERQQKTIVELESRLRNSSQSQPAAKEQKLDTSKVTPIDKKRSNQLVISEKIQSKLREVGLTLNTTLSKTIRSAASEEMVLFAIEALEEAILRGNIENPGGWLNAAIKDGWIPSEKHQPTGVAERDLFKQWFDIAYKQRLVLAATKGDDGQMYVFTKDGVPLPFKQMLTEYPLEMLKLRS
ncbi:hypothetical protein B7486_28900 [cyanobacterium TDX16]|nr:hypothetical protein B7486_28900 [cyanobacterium TDX16]